MDEKLKKTIDELTQSFAEIPQERKELLSGLVDYVKTKKESGEEANLIFICTHNSRRSHMSQLWAVAAAEHYGLNMVKSFSGGTEATALNEHARVALEDCGFSFRIESVGDNPKYAASIGGETKSVVVFSKEFSDAANPQKDFAAIMTCSEADANCPFVPGADKRIKLTYEDPKVSDGSGKEREVYLERAREIGREVLYAFSLVQ